MLTNRYNVVQFPMAKSEPIVEGSTVGIIRDAAISVYMKAREHGQNPKAWDEALVLLSHYYNVTNRLAHVTGIQGWYDLLTELTELYSHAHVRGLYAYHEAAKTTRGWCEL